MGYVIKIYDYENLLKSVRPYVQNEKSDLLYINDQLEAQVNYNRGSFELNHKSPSVKNELGSNSESLYIINESLDDGGNIMDLILGEENSEKYHNSLAGNGELYTLFGRLANAATATYSFFKDNFYFEEPLINSKYVMNDIKDMLLSFMGIQNNVSIATGGGKAKKAKKTKKKRKQKKHTKKLKYRKKSTKSPRKTEKKRK